MNKDEALRLALRAMVVNNQAWKYLADSNDAGNFDAEEQGYYQLNEQAITAIKAALEAKVEPASTGDTLFRQFMSEAEKAGVTHLAPPQRKPLTLEQLREHWKVAKVLDMTDAEIDFADYVLIARDVEALRGIKGEA